MYPHLLNRVSGSPAWSESTYPAFVCPSTFVSIVVGVVVSPTSATLNQQEHLGVRLRFLVLQLVAGDQQQITFKLLVMSGSPISRYSRTGQPDP